MRPITVPDCKLQFVRAPSDRLLGIRRGLNPVLSSPMHLLKAKLIFIFFGTSSHAFVSSGTVEMINNQSYLLYLVNVEKLALIFEPFIFFFNNIILQ